MDRRLWLFPMVLVAADITLLRAGGPPAGKAGTQGLEVQRLAAQFDGGRKWAVIIGINQYLDHQIPRLEFSVADAERMADTLAGKCGYDQKRILLLTDDQSRAHLRPLKINIEQQVAAWLKNAESTDIVLLFYSGHGFLDAEGRGYLAPQDCRKDRLAESGIRLDDLRNALSECKAVQKIVIMDCCHSGGIKSGASPGPSSQEVGAAFANAEGLLTLASCRKEEFSLEWKQSKQGLFTCFLVKGLGGEADYDGNGLVDSDELYRYLASEVPIAAQKELNGRQTPVRLIGPDVVGVFALARTAPRGESSRPGIPAGFAANDGGSQFVGVWDCTDAMIALNADFSAQKNRPKPLGKWEFVNGEVRIAWDDGVRNVLRRDTRGFRKLYWVPGNPTDSPPDSSLPAVYHGTGLGAMGSDASVFVGIWACTDVLITLNYDFTARKNRAKPMGRWEFVNGEARIFWDDGVRNVLRREGEAFRKLCWAPQVDMDSPPTNSYPAIRRYLRRDASAFIGVWDCGDVVITLDADYSARKNRHNPLGSWRFVNGEARIDWDDGVRNVLRRDGQGFRKLTWPAGAGTNSPPTSRYPATKRTTE